MPLPKKGQNTKQPAKIKTRRLADLNLPEGGKTPLFVGDAQKIKVQDLFPTDGKGKPLPFSARDEKTWYSTPFDILGVEASDYKGDTTYVFLIRDHDDKEQYWFFIGHSDQREAICEQFREDESPVVNVRLKKIDVGQASPFVSFEDSEEENEISL